MAVKNMGYAFDGRCLFSGAFKFPGDRCESPSEQL